MGCDGRPRQRRPGHDRVSIHAPAWGATPCLRKRKYSRGVSIHAPAWGATLSGTSSLLISMKFQSTHPRGVRLGSAFFVVKGFLVSIHAPAWGATPVLAKTSKSCPCFNPRTRVGCDLRTDREQRPVFICFNPRTRVGCDCQKAATHPVDEVVSIHAPAWGATMRTNRYRRFFEVSIHAPAWGATRNIRGNHLALVGFNPRTRVGCDARSRRSTANAMRFQSTHPRGVRRFRGWGRRRGHHVSIHAPAWGATMKM